MNKFIQRCFMFINSFNNCMTYNTKTDKIFHSIIFIIFIDVVYSNLITISTYLTRMFISFYNFFIKTTKSNFMVSYIGFLSINIYFIISTISGVLINIISTFSTKPFYSKWSATIIRAKTFCNKFMSLFKSPIIEICSSIFHSIIISPLNIIVKEELQWQSS